jgi:glycine/D-amino acid oxidase-like deaminating enzyme
MGKHVVIIGAGIVGCATAYFLAREGVEVTVLDAVGVAAGASGRNNGMIEHPYDPATVELFDESVGLLHELLGGEMPAQPVGTLLVAESEADAHLLVAHHSQFPELETQLLQPAAARAAEPLLAEDIWGCLLRTGYPVRPLEATSAFADLARQAGANFVVGPDLADSRYKTGAITAKRVLEGPDQPIVVVAAGAGTASVLEGYVRPDAVAPLWGVIVSVEMAERPRYQLTEGVLTIAHGAGTRSDEAPFTLLSSPSYLAVGSTMLRGAEPDGVAWSRRLLSRGIRFVPTIEQARILETLVCARPLAFDNRPIMGRVPGQERLWMATGHGGRGMSLGPASGRLMATAIIAGTDAAIPATLSATRL